jgi:coproporphyrinogen III oxidase-like Fe-S oxidoreductase
MASSTKLAKQPPKKLHKDAADPAASARAQLAHAFNATLDSLDLLAGTRAPTKSQSTVRGRVDIRHEVAAVDAMLENLTYEEAWVMKRLMEKASAEPEEAQEIDVIAEVVEELRHGTLSATASPYLHALPEADIVEH